MEYLNIEIQYDSKIRVLLKSSLQVNSEVYTVVLNDTLPVEWRIIGMFGHCQTHYEAILKNKISSSE